MQTPNTVEVVHFILGSLIFLGIFSWCWKQIPFIVFFFFLLCSSTYWSFIYNSYGWCCLQVVHNARHISTFFNRFWWAWTKGKAFLSPMNFDVCGITVSNLLRYKTEYMTYFLLSCLMWMHVLCTLKHYAFHYILHDLVCRWVMLSPVV